MLNQNSNLSEIADSIRHINEVFLPSIKQKLASKTYYDASNTFDALINNIAVDKLGAVKIAIGSGTFSTDRYGFAKAQVNGLGFRPRTVVFSCDRASQGKLLMYTETHFEIYDRKAVTTFHDDGFDMVDVFGTGTAYSQVVIQWLAFS